MKPIKLILLPLLVLSLFYGCQKPTPVPTGPLENLDLLTFFPQTAGFTWLYEGSYEFQAYETIVNIEETASDSSKTYLIEGAKVDLSDGEAGDLNFNRIIKVTKDSILDISGQQETLLLKNPIQVGQNWETVYFDQLLGYYQARAEIVTFEPGKITVRYSPIETAQYPAGMEEMVTFEISKGLTEVQKKLLLNIQQDDLTEFSYRILKTFTNKPKEIGLKYYSEEPLHKTIYALGSRTYETLETAEVYWQYRNRKEPVDERANHYADWLTSLDPEDIRSLALAKSILQSSIVESKEADDFVRIYLTYAEKQISEHFSDLIGRYQLDYEDMNNLATWDETNNRYFLTPLNQLNNEVARTLRPLLQDAAIMPYYNEGYPYSQLNGVQIIDAVRFNVSENYAKYLDLLRFDYEHFPIMYDGYFAVDKKLYLEHLLDMDVWAEANKDAPEAVKIAEERSWNLTLFLLPNYFYDDASFIGGFMSERYVSLLESVIQGRTTTTPSTTLIKSALEKLKSDHYLLTEGYLEWITDQGIQYEGVLSDQDKEAALQLDALKGIKTPFTAGNPSQTVEVSSLEELINAIAPNRTVKITSAALQIPYYSDIKTDYAHVQDGALLIENADGLVLEGAGELPATLLSQSNGMAMRLLSSDRVAFNNLRIGHVYEYCTEAALLVQDCTNTTIANTILFGCGDWGIHLENTQNTALISTVISDCNTYAAKIIDAVGTTFQNCMITRNGKNVIYLENAVTVLFDNCQITNNNGDAYTTDPAIFALKDSADITLKDSIVSGNKIKKLTEVEAAILNNNSVIE